LRRKKIEQKIETEELNSFPVEEKKMGEITEELSGEVEDISSRVTGGRMEDPFLPFPDKMLPVLQSLQDFFGISKNFPFSQLLIRSKKANTIYFVTQAARDLLLNDDCHRLRIVNTGVKMFAKHDAKDSIYKCPYRICSEGTNFLLPFLSKRVINITEADLINLLTKRDPYIKTFSTEARDMINQTEFGSLVFVLVATSKPELNGMAVSAWKGKVSCHLLASREDLVVLRRSFGIEEKNQNRDNRNIAHSTLKKEQFNDEEIEKINDTNIETKEVNEEKEQ